MTQEILNLVHDLAVTVGAGACGGLIVLLFSHRLALNRENDSRRREFTAFLVQWRTEIEHPPSTDGYFMPDFWKSYVAKIAAFNSEASKVKGVFCRRCKQLDSLISTVGGFKKDEADRKAQQQILEAMDKLIAFCS